MNDYLFVSLFVLTASPTEIQSRPNVNASLPCIVIAPPDLFWVDKSLISVSWISNGSAIASFRNESSTIKEGFSWDKSVFVSGDFSLTVLRASLDLQGLYECNVGYNSTILHSYNVTFSILASPTLFVPQQWVVLEKENQLRCHAEGFYPPPVSFSWTRDGKVIQPPYTTESHLTPDGYYTAAGNLTIYPSREDQNVTFGCNVWHNGSNWELNFKLNITYPASVRLSVLPSHSSNNPLTLSCDVKSFYPEEVSVTFLQNGTVLPNPPGTEQIPGGLYTTSRYYTLSSRQREQGGLVQCVVRQPGVEHPVSSSANLDKLDAKGEPPLLTKSAKASVAMMCISLVLVFLLCFGFSWRRRDEKQKSLNVSGVILPPRVTVGQKGRVTVSIEGRRVDRVQTAWFLNDTPISDTSHNASEKGRLLPSRGEMGYYKMHTLGPLHSSGSATQQLISSLTFIPQISIHKGAVFKCQVSYMGKDKIVVERVSEKFTILSAPEVSEIQLAESHNDSDLISMTVRATYFHPDVITFRWFCQGGELSPVASQASSSPRPDSEGFFSAYSQCKLPKSELEKGSTKVWVSVHHIALKQPITRETRGFVKRPCVSEIIGFTTSTDQTVNLGCEITDFYPANVSVTWLKLRDGDHDNEEEEEVIEGGEIWGPVQTHPRLYRATATLKRRATNLGIKERGGGVICRVEHCSLPEPIERHWKNFEPVAPTIPPSISVCWSSEGVGVFSLLLKGGYPKPKILWAAGGPTLSQLVSSETEEIGDDGQRELKSVCALETSTSPPNQTSKQLKKKNSLTIKTKDAVADPSTKGIKYIDERVDGENNNINREDETKLDLDDDSDRESEQDEDKDEGALHINRVNLRSWVIENERARLRVCVEITHPTLKLPVYRTWTDFSLTVLRASLDLQGLYECNVGYNSTILHSYNVTFSILASPTLFVPQQWVVLEKENQLRCHAEGFYPPPVSFSWTRDGKVIQPPYTTESHLTPDGYYTAAGNLTIYPSREDQNVTFGCNVWHNGSNWELNFKLNITYPASVRLSVLPSHSSNNPLTLSCDVKSFYPEEVSVTFLQNGTVLPNPPGTEQIPGGLYTTSRYYTLSSRQREQGGLVQCVVRQPGVEHPVSSSANLDKLDAKGEPPLLTKSAKASVAMMCISLVLVFLLCFGFSWRRRDEKQKSLNVSGVILPPRVTVGQKGRVTVSIEGRRVDRVQTAWFLNDTPISDTSHNGRSTMVVLT
uniref:Si:ch211-180a12.2 n=1 Tax=Tetraodon nigroviridis TaxID=99883 RepID=H3DCM3_TETNG